MAFQVTLAPLAVSRFRVISNCNAAFAELFGYSREKLVGSSWAMLFPSYDDFVSRGRAILSGLRSDPVYQDERLMMRADHGLFWCRVRGITLSVDNPFKLIVWNVERIERSTADIAELSPREREVAAYISEGLTSKQIGERLGLSHRTIERHRARLKQKLGTRNAAALTARIAAGGGA